MTDNRNQMKRLLLILLASGIVIAGAAQTLTQNYMQQLPALPRDSCNISRNSAEAFESRVDALKEKLDQEIESIKEAVDTHMESNAGKAQENMMKQMSQMYGISNEDMDKMKNARTMSAADKQAMANKMMQQQANMSMDEAKNLAKMSDAGRQAYAEAYATEAMATANSDPGQAARNNHASNLYQTNVAQQEAYSKINEINNRIAALYAPITNDPERQRMLDRIDGMNKKRYSMMGILSDGEAQVMDSLTNRIKDEQIAYCNKYTPLYRAALRKHLQIVKTSMPDFQSFGEISAETTKGQTGIDQPAAGRELASLEAVSAYLGALKDAYKYKIYYPEDN